MSKIVYVEAKPGEANAAHCYDCEGDRQCFYDGLAAIKQHAESFPLHGRVTYLKREIV
jgi:hypothetical protein